MPDLTSDAYACYRILSGMVRNREPCRKAHPLHKQMRNLQRRYSGVFPDDLKELWDWVRLPAHPDAVIQYHDGVERLKDWFELNFHFNEEPENATSAGPETQSGQPHALRWDEYQDRLDQVEERLGPGQEPDPGYAEGG